LEKLQAERKVKEDGGEVMFKSSDEDTESLITMTKAFHRYLE